MKTVQDIRDAFGNGHGISRPVNWRAPVIFASPHSGAIYPRGFRRAAGLSLTDLRRNEDAYVDHLFGATPRLGAPLLWARFPRCYVDVNRPGDDLPPEWLEPGASRLGASGSYKGRLGLGVVPTVIGENLPIHRTLPSRAEVQARLDALYWPYHRALGGLLHRAQSRWGEALLIDCHSMPGTVPNRKTGRRHRRPDIILGDGHGKSAREETTSLLQSLFERRGYRVVRNHPYAGGHSTLHYGKPASGVEAVQIEINRDLYLDERNLVPHEGFTELGRDITAICSDLIAAREIPEALQAAE